uniref:Exonuclease domain-containing protein n=2 Tax=Caenorhabditis tropicalis TaxID=1561998 RepID=A0A1I7TML1_9PELO
MAEIAEEKERERESKVFTKEMLEVRAAELAEKMYQERIAREAKQKASEKRAQKTTVQESQVSTSQATRIKPPSASPSSSSEDDIVPLRRKKAVIEDSDDEDWEKEEEERKKKERNATKSNSREKKRRVISTDSEDDMPVVQKRSKSRRDSSDDEMNEKEWKGSSASESEENSDIDDFIDDGDEEDDMHDFIVDDEEEVLSEEEDDLEKAERLLKRTHKNKRTNQRRSVTPPRQKRSTPAKESKPNSIVDDHKRLSEPGTSATARPMTEEEKKRARRLKTIKTKEENREKKRLARLDALNRTGPITVGRRTRFNEPNEGDPLDVTLNYTINQFHETVKKSSRKDSQDSQQKESRKEQAASINKRSTPSTTEDRDDEGVHVPAKRMAHSNSVPNPSKTRPTTSSSRTHRPNQSEMLDKRAKEAEEKKKRDRAEFEKLKAKTFLTNEEQGRVKQLQALFGTKPAARQVARSSSTSTPSTSANFRNMKIKKEVDSSPVKKAPTLSPLAPSKGTSFHKSRIYAVNAIYQALLDLKLPDAAEQAQKMELKLVESHPTRDKYKPAAAHKIRECRSRSDSGILEVNKNDWEPKKLLTVNLTHPLHDYHYGQNMNPGPLYYQEPTLFQFYWPPQPPSPPAASSYYISFPSTSYTPKQQYYPEYQSPYMYPDTPPRQQISRVPFQTVSHDRILAGGVAKDCTVGNNRKTHIPHHLLTIEQLHPMLVKLKMTESELEKEAYPLFKNNTKIVTIAETQYTKNKKMFLEDYDMTRTCSRCNKEFSLKPDGTMVKEKDICRYHQRGICKEGKRDTFRKRYRCCNEEYNVAPGCKFSDVHVFDQLFKRELGKFVATPPPTSSNDPRTIKAYAIDCEMVYTVAGPALARLTMVDMQSKKVLDIFIKPPTEVLDPNTEFSGLTMEQIQNAKDTMQTCHQKLFKLVNSETILIGHSLESDLKSMRIVHKSVIDTAILFRSSGDYKVALKNLSSDLLRKTIQGDNEDAVGHDSLEDAITCVDLIYYGLKNPESLAIR